MTVDIQWLAREFPDISALTPLGVGGQKWVFSGQHGTEGAIVLKLFHPTVEPGRVLREVQAPQSIGSPRVPRILTTGTKPSPIGDLIWVQEERIPGENLRRVLQGGPLPAPDILRLGLHVLEALAAAEEVRIVHRDVKPENIIIDTVGDAWLLDFGLARHLDLASLTVTAAAFGVGTPGYAPPEQFRNRKIEIDGRADLFGIGVTLYECVEGVNPFCVAARDVGEVLRRVETQALPPLSRPVDGTGAFRDLVLAMTRPRREHRPRTVAEALEWMREISTAAGIA